MEYLGISMEYAGTWMDDVAKLIDYVGISSWNINEIWWKLNGYVGISTGYLGTSMEYNE